MSTLAAAASVALAISDLLGLSPAQMRQRLDLAPVPQNLITSVRLTPEGRESALSYRDLIAEECASGEFARVGLDALDNSMFSQTLEFRFRDGKLTQVIDQRGELADPSRKLLVGCQGRRKGNSASDVAQVAAYSPFILLAQLGRAPATARQAGANADLGKLRLGQTPPGGFDAYFQRLPKDALIVSRAGQDAVLRFKLGSGVGGAQMVDVTLKAGQVTQIAKDRLNFRACQLRTDDSLSCETPLHP